MKPQQRKPKFSKKQIFIATLLTEFAIGVGAGFLHPALGIVIDVGMTTIHIATYKDKNNKDE
ncbi:hypothetical protein [Microcoleus sp. FACHB-68]|uniref:hypothetical protein n=1 Tax=Microcoleus sp. FACHB-68 TaxID=2692826 RepID=UPI00168A1CC4|nr:hypothetical protein [Microcoleus sp. FACHB-68]MBD1936446.1 hypothetical protein [Microcoleus sp. FACHB-68]